MRHVVVDTNVANADYIVSEDSHFRVLDNIIFPKVNVLSLDQFSNEIE